MKRQPLILTKDPAGLPRAPRAPALFNGAPHRNRHMPTLPRPIPCLPDDYLIATVVGLGMPRQDAEQVRYSPQRRFDVAAIVCDVMDAIEGDRAARERVDYLRYCWQRSSRRQIVGQLTGEEIRS